MLCKSSSLDDEVTTYIKKSLEPSLHILIIKCNCCKDGMCSVSNIYDGIGRCLLNVRKFIPEHECDHNPMTLTMAQLMTPILNTSANSCRRGLTLLCLK